MFDKANGRHIWHRRAAWRDFFVAKPDGHRRKAAAPAYIAVSLVALFAGCSAEPQKSESWKVMYSPDKKIQVVVTATGQLDYSVQVDGAAVLMSSRLGLKLRGGTTLGQDVEFVREVRQTGDTTWENRLGKRRTVRDNFNELRLTLRERSAGGRTFDVVFRAYDDGVAFRYALPANAGSSNATADKFVVEQEQTQFTFAGDHECFAGDQGGFRGPQEYEFAPHHLTDLKPETTIGLPLLVKTPAAWVAITEADLLDWAGMWLGGGEAASAAGGPQSDPKTVSLVTKLAPRLDQQGLVLGTLPHKSPWRVLMIGRQPGQLIESEIVRNLSTPSKMADTSWIKPGLMAWDHWWSGDVQMDTATIKQYIQLAADMGWPYQLIDWHWYGEPNKPEADITKVTPELDMPEIRRFAAERGVRLWLWVNNNDLNRNDAYLKAFPLYHEWGIAGVKIDFMDRDDQEMVEWYEKMTAAAAEHKLMVIYHGAFKTSGFDRTYPNQVTREGVLGNEYNKWSDRVTPEHKLTLPFTRFLAGPADFTPGGFLNRQPSQFKPQKPTLVQGTRAAELALFVVYDSAVTCACDHPDNYRDQPGADFLKIVPTVWDETRVLDAAVGEHLALVRQAGDEWYLAALTNKERREINVRLDFLGPGQWKRKLWQDAADADKNAEHLVVDERNVMAADTLTLTLAPAGAVWADLQNNDSSTGECKTPSAPRNTSLAFVFLGELGVLSVSLILLELPLRCEVFPCCALPFV